ncbi:Hydroxyacylglutathione hydrolase [Oligella ureolytica]|uniref:Hydroxyacylglutathione hydrolase n=1 Tax=Oligella ureolytica TaxID=90244 RepID=A0A378XGC5_9BURK|nr:hydroxyacylglutathione hydrolase [Oligella ureolytica]QPT39563.1 hydroxyacylglutathione hydrolase [Oligella ureolytica]SUA52875.1 Hydroxyacylglutathione hydrolase [Oligella ureolytica]SUA56700.1 Hydroxyacylglutathione hydrolase [Oligella ureolytica]
MNTEIYPISAFNDNYIWIVQQGTNAVVVDPGQAAPVISDLESKNLNLKGILITHHHDDHTGGVQELVARYDVPVYGPAFETRPIPCLNEGLTEGDSVRIEGIDAEFQVLEVPGHTMGHIAYTTLISSDQPVLFCGDTLFSCGCGRIFEGDSRLMLQSVDKLGEMPHNTLVCCAHEYTLSNIDWALAVEPDNSELQKWSHRARDLRAQNLPTLPTTMAQEQATNPFLRVREPSVIKAAQSYAGTELGEDAAVFAALREWKNNA